MWRRYRSGAAALALAAMCGCDDAAPDRVPPKENAERPVAAKGVKQPEPKQPKPKQPKPKQPEPKRPYNVLLIMIDSLRADMPWAGYPRAIAPKLTELAKRCTLYPRAYSLSSYTAKSVAPALAGRYPSEMKRDGYFFTRWMPDNEFVSERAQAAGHRTLAGNGHGYFLPAMGLNQGFDDYRLLPGTFLDTKGVFDVTSEKLNGLAKQMLSAAENLPREDRRFFAYFHFLDPHYTYYKHEGHPDFGSKRRDLYDNEVHFTDHWVGDLIDWVRRQSWGDQTAVIITADHGEGFGEHDHYRHSYEVWEALVRVPLFLCVPGADPRRIEQPRGHIDLAPTVADLMGLSKDTAQRGHSLVPEVFGAEPEPRPVVVDLPRCDLMDRRRAVIDGSYKLIGFGNDTSFQLYDVTADFKEERELSEQEPQQLERMKKLYEQLSSEIPNAKVVGDAPLKGARPGQRW